MVSTYLVQRGNTEEGIKAALGGLEADVVLKCTGAESPLAAAIFAVRFGGTVFVVGIRLVDSGVLAGIRKLVTHQFPFEDAVKAFETSADVKTSAIRVQITNL